jgi:hypothetical protein
VRVWAGGGGGVCVRGSVCVGGGWGGVRGGGAVVLVWGVGRGVCPTCSGSFTRGYGEGGSAVRNGRGGCRWR